MNVNDMTSLKRAFQPSDVLTALALLTRLPLPYVPSAGRAPANAAWAYPLAGLIVGAIALAVGWIVQTLGGAAPIVRPPQMRPALVSCAERRSPTDAHMVWRGHAA